MLNELLMRHFNLFETKQKVSSLNKHLTTCQPRVLLYIRQWQDEDKQDVSFVLNQCLPHQSKQPL